MIYVIQIKTPFKYLAGISEDKKMIHNHWNSLPIEIRSHSEILEFEILKYPFWVLESEGFKFLNERELEAAIKKTKTQLKNEKDNFNLYLIEEEFLPDEPGSDEMGILKHQHFDKQKINEWEKNGMAYLERIFNISSK